MPIATGNDEEEEVPVARGRFENLALNDTLQLRHQQLHQSHGISSAPGKEEATLPPSAIIYDPPPPRVVKLKKEAAPDLGRGIKTTSHDREKHSLTMTEDRRRLPPMSNSTHDPSLTQQTTKSKSRMTSSQTPRAPVQNSAQQRLNRSTGKRRFDDLDSGVPSSADEQRGTSVVPPPRPGSSRSLRGEKEVARSSLEADNDPGTLRPLTGQAQTMQQRPHYPQQPSYSDYRQQSYNGFQPDPNERMHNMQVQRPVLQGVGGAPYYGPGNEYLSQGQGSSPVEQNRGIYTNGMGVHPVSTPGYTMEGHGLMRTSSMPTGERSRGPVPPSHMIGPDGNRAIIVRYYLIIEPLSGLIFP
jgi:hypothetical protein